MRTKQNTASYSQLASRLHPAAKGRMHIFYPRENKYKNYSGNWIKKGKRIKTELPSHSGMEKRSDSNSIWLRKARRRRDLIQKIADSYFIACPSLKASDFFTLRKSFLFTFFSTYKLVVRLCRCRVREKKKRANEKIFRRWFFCVPRILVIIIVIMCNKHPHIAPTINEFRRSSFSLMCRVGKKKGHWMHIEREKTFW